MITELRFLWLKLFVKRKWRLSPLFKTTRCFSCIVRKSWQFNDGSFIVSLSGSSFLLWALTDFTLARTLSPHRVFSWLFKKQSISWRSLAGSGNSLRDTVGRWQSSRLQQRRRTLPHLSLRGWQSLERPLPPLSHATVFANGAGRNVPKDGYITEWWAPNPSRGRTLGTNVTLWYLMGSGSETAVVRIAPRRWKHCPVTFRRKMRLIVTRNLRRCFLNVLETRFNIT